MISNQHKYSIITTAMLTLKTELYLLPQKNGSKQCYGSRITIYFRLGTKKRFKSIG